MNITELLEGKRNCVCGIPHLCPIDSVVIEKNACLKLPSLTENYRNILLVADKNTYSVCGKHVDDILAPKIYSRVIFCRDGLLVPNEEAIAEIENALTQDCDLIIGIGSGVINDLCKIVSFKAKLRYYIVATAPSMDGYASKGSALILDGMKVTLNANVPKAIIADVDVLANAPFEMIQAGYGDIIGKYSCLNDWQLSALVNNEYLCEYVMNATYEAVETTVKLADGIRERNTNAIGALMEALVAVGILMAYVGNSRPASGSEHHLSHYFEIVGIERGEEYLAHGIDVCFSAVETAKIREKLLAIPNISDYNHHFDRSNYESNVRRIYGSVADEVLALQNKMGWYEVDRVSIYKEKWADIRKILANAPSSKEMLALCRKVGLNYNDYLSLYGDEKISDAILYAKDLKDRYTVLWMYYDLMNK
jgi:glycerol-1-phosphate dehydrogenase [NAD(P)+]